MTNLEPAGGECPICDEPIVINRSTNALVTRGYVNAIADAVEHANAHPSNSAREDYDMRYTVSEGYYPGDNTHEIDLSNIPTELQGSAMIQAQSQLADRRLMVNSVDFEAATLHVVTANWLLERLPGMGAEYR